MTPDTIVTTLARSLFLALGHSAASWDALPAAMRLQHKRAGARVLIEALWQVQNFELDAGEEEAADALAFLAVSMGEGLRLQFAPDQRCRSTGCIEDVGVNPGLYCWDCLRRSARAQRPTRCN